jgi:iron complex outermembrane receptor protein
MRQLLYICFILPGFLQAQIKDTLPLGEVEVRAPRFSQYQAGFKYTRIDSSIIMLFSAGSLADVLQFASPVFIRNYGPSGIATASFRGASPEQTAVLWNGFNIQNSMLGLFDFSLYPAAASNQIELQHGGNGALFGSGAVGGTILLNNTPRFGSGVQVDMSITGGSFGLMQQVAGISFGGKKHYSSIQFINRIANNNFSYKPDPTNTLQKKQTHAATSQRTLTFSENVRPNRHHLFGVNVFLQESTREIPPSLYEIASDAKQDDATLRIGINWQYKNGRHTLNARSGWLHDRLNYSSPAKQIDSRNNVTNWINELEDQWKIKQWLQVNTGINYTQTTALSNNYNDTKIQHRVSAFYAAKVSWKNLILQQSSRIEKIDSRYTPLIPMLGLEWKFHPLLKLQSTASVSYRIPTFNERYWWPGGNPNLLPESGKNAEAGIYHAHHKNNICWQVNSTFYYRKMNNQIVWLPSGMNPVPENIRETETWGNENNITVALQLRKNWNAKATALINFISAKNKSGISATDESKDKYLLFVPRLTQQYIFGLTYKKTQISYVHSYTGMQFTSADNLNTLSDFIIGNLTLSYQIKLGMFTSDLMFAVNNIGNTNYLIVTDRPMPGRNFQLTLKINIHTK